MGAVVYGWYAHRLGKLPAPMSCLTSDEEAAVAEARGVSVRDDCQVSVIGFHIDHDGSGGRGKWLVVWFNRGRLQGAPELVGSVEWHRRAHDGVDVLDSTKHPRVVGPDGGPRLGGAVRGRPARTLSAR